MDAYLDMKYDLCQVVSPCLIKPNRFESLKSIDFVCESAINVLKLHEVVKFFF